MDCRKAEEEILESFEDGGLKDAQQTLNAHLAACAACAEFAARQQAVEARLGRALTPPELSATFHKALRRRIRRETMNMWWDWLPEGVHFVSCSLATVLCAIFMPFDARMILSAGTAATVVTYLLLAGVRNSFEDIEDPGQ